ncbi:unnamed protein product [Caretta caretta]
MGERQQSTHRSEDTMVTRSKYIDFSYAIHVAEVVCFLFMNEQTISIEEVMSYHVVGCIGSLTYNCLPVAAGDRRNTGPSGLEPGTDYIGKSLEPGTG